jgi:hypothetical protein
MGDRFFWHGNESSGFIKCGNFWQYAQANFFNRHYPFAQSYLSLVLISRLSDIARHKFRNDGYMISLFHRISMLQSGGLLRKFKLDSWPAHAPVAENTWTSVGAGQVSPLLTILSGGIATSLALLLIEITIRRWKKQSQRRNEWPSQFSKQLHTKHLLFQV